MADLHRQLTERLRELRRRHFGPRGKAEFARRLNLPLMEYEQLERGSLPSGELMVRMCEVTGEDLQWLLTGREARQALVISGARRRHRDLIARIAALLEERPALAGPIEGFVSLISAAPGAGPPGLPQPAPLDLIPILEMQDLPLDLKLLPTGPARPWLPPPGGEDGPVTPATISEPLEHRVPNAAATAQVITWTDADGRQRRFVRSPQILASFPDAFAVRVNDDSMAPLMARGDAVIVAPEAPAELGRPALYRTDTGAACRVWLGIKDGRVQLGRALDGAREDVAEDSVRWSLAVLFRLSPAA